MIERQLTLIMENKPGALARVVGLFHQRGYNIDSLHVDPIEDFSSYKFIEDELDVKFSKGEVSGLVILNDSTFWWHNDSGAAPELFCTNGIESYI